MEQDKVQAALDDYAQAIRNTTNASANWEDGMAKEYAIYLRSMVEEVTARIMVDKEIGNKIQAQNKITAYARRDNP